MESWNDGIVGRLKLSAAREAFLKAALEYANWSWRDGSDEHLEDVGYRFFEAAEVYEKAGGE